MMAQRATYGVLPALAAFCTVAVFGCSGSTTVETNYVEGVVTLDGNPVDGATVTFVPVTKGQGMSATGKTDGAGKYTLSAVGGGQLAGEAGGGTLEGEYYVGVVKSEMELPPNEEEQEGGGGVESEPSGEISESKVTHIVPERYSNPRQSGLKVTVKKGKNTIPIELTSR